MAIVREDEWLAELTRLSQRNDGGLTSGEWATKLGQSAGTVVKLLHKAASRGWLVVGERSGTNLRGRPCNFTVYSIVKPRASRRAARRAR